MKILITGIAGAMARLVARELLDQGHEIIGLDPRPWPDCPPDVRCFRFDLRKRPAEDVFRNERPDVVVHMATVTYFSARREERYRINMHGTRALLEHCDKYGVKQAVFVGRHTIYGAAADAPLYRTEAEPPLATGTFPDLADLVAADLFAQSALWRYPELRTAVLRMVYTLGPSRRGTLASYLGGKRVPMVLGFDPLFQFMHEQDAARAITLAVHHDLNGVYNVAGPQPVPLSLLCSAIGKQAVPLPEFAFRRALGRLGFPLMPRGSISHVKYPIVVDGEAFADATGFTPDYDEVQVMDGYRYA